jgi:NDP-sugar pyrophosphorylase family protein
VLGANVVIGNGTIVRNSILMDGVTIGPGVRIHDSIIASGARVGPDSHISELTVVGAGVEVPAQSELTGARLPESD